MDLGRRDSGSAVRRGTDAWTQPASARHRRVVVVATLILVLLALPGARSALAAFIDSTGNVANTATAQSCFDPDGDGLCTPFEDGNSDSDNIPSTSPGPDYDQDTVPNYLDSDDDGDGVATSLEDADPNGDGDPSDARDDDFDGQPTYLDPTRTATSGVVSGEVKISSTVGGLTGPLSNSDTFGTSAAAIGDVDGDGVVDLAVGARHDNDGGIDHGAVYVLFLNANGTVKAEQKISDTQGGLTAALGHGHGFGVTVNSIGDLDGDGIAELAVGSHGDDDGGPDRGAVYVLFLNANGTVRAEQKISDTQGGLTATLDDYDYFGSASGVGDLDGDGIPDMIVGSVGDNDGGIDRGAVYVLFLNTNGTVKAEQKISDTQGGLTATLDDYDYFGGTAGLGDVDGDGLPDVAVSTNLDDDGGTNRGAVYVLFLNANGTVKAEQKISDTQGGLTAALQDSDDFGWDVAGVGDLDQDSVPDLLVGSRLDDDGGSDSGAAYVLFLNSNGTVKAEQKISDTQGGFTGTLETSDQFGSAVASLGDLDEDGNPDIVVGAWGDDDGDFNHGAVYILEL